MFWRKKRLPNSASGWTEGPPSLLFRIMSRFHSETAVKGASFVLLSVPPGEELVRVVPIVQSAKGAADATLTLVSIELYLSGVLLTSVVSYKKRLNWEHPDDAFRHMIDARHRLELADDVGTTYLGEHGSGSGSENHWRLGMRYQPAVPPDAKRLTITAFHDSERESVKSDKPQIPVATFVVDV